MSNKITWKKILEDFKLRHPRLGKTVTYWRPHDYAQIYIVCEDNLRLIYDYDAHRADIVHETYDKRKK